jgi:hypothetical protein
MNIEVSFKEVSKLIQSAFPGAKSRRTVKVAPKAIYHVADYWDGGSRNECRFIQLSSGTVMGSHDIPEALRQKVANPFNLPICDVTLKAGFIVVEHVIFCGKDLGYRIYCSPERFESLSGTDLVTSLTAHECVRQLVANNNNDTLPAPSELYDNGPATIPYRHAL